MAIPEELADVPAFRRALKVKYQPMGASAEEALTILPMELVDGYVHVPRQFGLRWCTQRKIEYVNETSLGDAIEFPKVPSPRDYQEGPLEQLEECAGGYYDFLFRARTGWGKTVGSLIFAARLGRSTLVLVDQENLKDQWVKALVDLFGVKHEDIGIIQGKTCTYQGKAVTVAMVQTLRSKRGDDPLFRAFGLLIVDEVHVIGAPTFSSVLPKIAAAYRVGVSATPRRRDTLQKLIDYHLGRVRVYIDDEHDESRVYVLENDTVYTWYANAAPKIGRFISEVADDAQRNMLIVEAIRFLYETGRDVIVLSDRIEHLRSLMDFCYYLGIPGEDMGLIVGMAPAYSYDKDPSPLRRPYGYQRKAEYTPLSLQLISKRVKKAEVDHITDTAQVVFATYGKCAKGFDLPRLSGGIDATPRSQAEQVQGRILRAVKGKQQAIWVTIADTASYRSMFSLASRISGYAENNSILLTGAGSSLDSPEGWTECDATTLRADTMREVTRLKSMRIETDNDGLNTLRTQEQVTRAEIQRAKNTAAAHRARRRS